MESITISLSSASTLACALPAPCRLGMDCVSSPAYRYAGAERQSEAGLQVFQYTLGGCGRFRMGGEIFLVPAGIGFLCELYDPRIVYYYDQDDTAPWRFLYVVFRGMESWVRDITAARGHLFAVPERSPALQAFRRLLTGVDEIPPPLDAATGLDMTTALFAQLCRSSEGRPISKAQHLLDRAIAMMHERVESDDRITDFAVRLGVSAEHLCRVFQAEMRLTPLAYFHRQKIRRACMLLADTHIPVKEIAARLGMENVSNFTRFFKRYMAMPPAVFRSRGSTACFATDLW